MRIRFPGLLLGFAAAAMAAAMPPQLLSGPGGIAEATPGRPKRGKRLPRGMAARSSPKAIRSRWKAARPKRRPNRLHISRRARRRHRKAG